MEQKPVNQEVNDPINYASALASLPDFIRDLKMPFYTTDADGWITFFNQGAVELWGREPQAGNDRWCGSWKMYQADGSALQPERSPLAKAIKEQRFLRAEEILFIRPDGSKCYVSQHPQPFFNSDGSMEGAINILFDITGFKRIQAMLLESETRYQDLAETFENKVHEKTEELNKRTEELKKSEDRYHRMIDEVEDYAIILLDPQGIIQNWNKGAEKIKGYNEKEIVGRSFLNFYHPEDQKKGLPLSLLNKARENGSAQHEGWRMRKDGTAFWGSIVLTALHDSENNILGFSKVTRDLTERKLAEDRLKEYSAQLEFQNRELEQFAYASSHDMKEPLRKIHLYNSSVLENTANTLDDKSKEYLKRSLNAVKRMTNLIEDLLNYSRTTASLDCFELVDLGEIVEEIALLHRDVFQEKKARLEFGELPVIYGVPFQFKQLMDNLISNSIKYKHPDRNLVIRISSALVRGSSINQNEVEKGRDYHKISVIDNGIGFDARHAEKVFDIFQRLNNLPGTHGSGIGLAICKRIVQNHKGFIEAGGKIDEGAWFDIYLPAGS